jgi:cytochrome b561
MKNEHADPTVPSNTAERYGSGAIAFHWIMFLLLILVGALGLLHDSWPKRTHVFWINVHAILGLLLWLTLIARFWWRMLHDPPALPLDVGTYSRRLSIPVHVGLYALMFITPIVGVVTFVWHGRIFDFGLFQMNFRVRSDRTIFEPTEDIHGYLAYALFALAGIHIVAALWHQFILRDRVLGRMWPRRDPSTRASVS